MSHHQSNSDPPLSEPEIMEQAKHNLTAFVPIYEAYVDRIYAYCRHRVSSAQDAEDLTSQVFARAMARCRTYRGGSVGAWLFRIAYHITVDYYRDSTPAPLTDDALMMVTDHRNRPPLEEVVYREQLTLLKEWLADLSDEKRNLLLLRITGELSAAEIGDIVGKSATAVRVEIHRIIQKLKQNALNYQ